MNVLMVNKASLQLHPLGKPTYEGLNCVSTMCHTRCSGMFELRFQAWLNMKRLGMFRILINCLCFSIMILLLTYKSSRAAVSFHTYVNIYSSHFNPISLHALIDLLGMPSAPGDLFVSLSHDLIFLVLERHGLLLRRYGLA